MTKVKFTKGQKVRYDGIDGFIRSVSLHYDGTIYYTVKYGKFSATGLTKHDPIQAI